MRKAIVALFISTALWTGCGAPSAPLPPSLRLPAPVQDLAAERRGEKVTLRWTPPRLTSDGVALKPHWRGPTRVCRAIGQTMNGCLDVVASLGADAAATASGQIVLTDTLPESATQQYPMANAEYAVEVVNNLGRTAGLSNRVAVPLAPTLPAPKDVRVGVTPRALLIRFTGVAPVENAQLDFTYRLLRRDLAADDKNGELPAGELPAASGVLTFEDTNFTWEHKYEYRVVPVTRVMAAGRQLAEALGAESERLSITVKDAFPPAVPRGLQAVASASESEQYVDLTWEPNSETDLAGYNVYRQENGSRTKLNSELVAVPSFRDAKNARGTYAVTAIDLRGNESSASPPASER